MQYLFKDRRQAGRQLGMALERYRHPATLVLGLPRGGVVVADEVARTLGAQLGVIVTRKVSAPGNPEYAVGAVAEGGAVFVNEQEVAHLGIEPSYLSSEVAREEEQIARRVQLYRDGQPLPPLRDRPVIVVDDGIATGFTMLAALRAVQALGARPVVMATPLAPVATFDHLSYVCDDAIALETPIPFYAVGMFYEDFQQVTDEEVLQLLRPRRQQAA